MNKFYVVTCLLVVSLFNCACPSRHNWPLSPFIFGSKPLQTIISLSTCRKLKLLSSKSYFEFRMSQRLAVVTSALNHQKQLILCYFFLYIFYSSYTYLIEVIVVRWNTIRSLAVASIDSCFCIEIATAMIIRASTLHYICSIKLLAPENNPSLSELLPILWNTAEEFC